MTDFDGFLETATFCRLNDEKRPGTVGLPDATQTQVCPEDLSKPAETNGTAQGVPGAWFVRVAFDRLLDPTIEDLVPELDESGMPTGVVFGSLEKTQPVTLKCGGKDIAYDGYYVPNGNSISWPVGPALFIEPLDPADAETGATCEVTVLDKVHSKSGQSVPSEGRTFKFEIAAMSLRSTEPDPEDADPDAPGAIEVAPTDPVTYTWTASIGAAPAAAEIKIWEGANGADGKPNAAVCATGGGTIVDAAKILAAANAKDDTQLDLGVSDGVTAGKPSWKASTTYRIEFTSNAKVGPAQGGAAGDFPADYSLCFHTTAE